VEIARPKLLKNAAEPSGNGFADNVPMAITGTPIVAAKTALWPAA